MKHKLIAISLLAVSLAASKGYSQAIGNRAQVPFAFTAGSVAMPAGEYVIQRKSGSNIVSFDDLTTGKIVSVMAMEHDMLPMDAPSKLVFRQYGGQHFLAAVWQGGGGTAAIFSAPGSDKHLPADSKAPKEDMVALQ